MGEEKRVSYQHSASYATLNTYSTNTRNIWMVFHGMGYLSKFFLRYFDDLSANENYIIAPQAPSKYYIDSNFKHVGASWLTREDTQEETKNVLNYIDAVWNKEHKESNANLIVMGYSQGVSIAMRWVASRKIQCDQLVLHSGGIPVELKQQDFSFLNSDMKVTSIYGLNDQYINPERLQKESETAIGLFGHRLTIKTFQGTHEVNKEFLQEISAL